MAFYPTAGRRCLLPGRLLAAVACCVVWGAARVAQEAAAVPSVCCERAPENRTEDILQSMRFRILEIQRKMLRNIEFPPEKNLLKSIFVEYRELYHLAEARYKQGLIPARGIYEIGVEWYACADALTFFSDIDSALGEVPPPEYLASLRRVLTTAAAEMENREEWLRTEILWYRHVERDSEKAGAYQGELVELLRKRYREGLVSLWEVENAALDWQGMCLFLPPVDEVPARMEAWAGASAEFYKRMLQAAAETGGSDASFREQLLRAECRMLESRLSLDLIRKTSSHLSAPSTSR